MYFHYVHSYFRENMPHQSQYLHFWFEKYCFIYKYIHKGSCWPDRKAFIHHQVFLVLDSVAISGEPDSSVQLLSLVWLFVTLWTAACQASLSITNCWSLPKSMFIELVMPFNLLILCHPLLLLPSIFPRIRVFSNESALCIRWPTCWSFSFNISPSNGTPRTDQSRPYFHTSCVLLGRDRQVTVIR